MLPVMIRSSSFWWRRCSGNNCPLHPSRGEVRQQRLYLLQINYLLMFPHPRWSRESLRWTDAQEFVPGTWECWKNSLSSRRPNEIIENVNSSRTFCSEYRGDVSDGNLTQPLTRETVQEDSSQTTPRQVRDSFEYFLSAHLDKKCPRQPCPSVHSTWLSAMDWCVESESMTMSGCSLRSPINRSLSIALLCFCWMCVGRSCHGDDRVCSLYTRWAFELPFSCLLPVARCTSVKPLLLPRPRFIPSNLWININLKKIIKKLNSEQFW